MSERKPDFGPTVLTRGNELFSVERGDDGQLVIHRWGCDFSRSSAATFRLSAEMSARLGNLLLHRAKQLGVPDSVAEEDNLEMNAPPYDRSAIW